jgi:hypothetical protein
VGREDVKLADLEEMLDTIKDVLWLLDVYTGHGWAMGYLRPEFVKQLTAEAAK